MCKNISYTLGLKYANKSCTNIYHYLWILIILRTFWNKYCCESLSDSWPNYLYFSFSNYNETLKIHDLLFLFLADILLPISAICVESDDSPRIALTSGVPSLDMINQLFVGRFFLRLIWSVTLFNKLRISIKKITLNNRRSCVIIFVYFYHNESINKHSEIVNYNNYNFVIIKTNI